MDTSDLPLPILGLNRAMQYARKPILHTEEAINVRGFDVIENRGRIGSRPGLLKYFSTQLGSGNPVRLANFVRPYTSSSLRTLTDSFTNSGGALDTAIWESFSYSGFPAQPIVDEANDNAEVTPNSPSTVRGDAIIKASAADVSLTVKRSIQGYVRGVNNSTKKIRLGLDALPGTDPYASSVYIEWTSTPSIGTVTLYVNGVAVGSGTRVATSTFVYIRLEISSSNVITVSYGTAPSTMVTLVTYSATGYTPLADSLPWMGILTTGTQTPEIFEYVVEYSHGAGAMPPEAVVLSSNGILYEETASGVISAVSHSNLPVLRSDRYISSAQFGEKLYIADYELIAEGTAGAISTAETPDRFTDTDAVASGAWDDLGIDLNGMVIEILARTGTIALGVYTITAVDAGGTYININNSQGQTGSAITWRILRAPKVYDPSTHTLARMSEVVGTSADTDILQVGCRSVTLWQGRLVWCNDPRNPREYFMSRAEAPTDYDYNDTDVDAAVAGVTQEMAGLPGEPLVTTIPLNKTQLVFACTTSFYILDGSPRLGARLDNITRDVGIVDIPAWCITSDGHLIVLTSVGLYEITPVQAIPISRDVIPQELIGLKSESYTISLAYDTRHHGIHILATPLVVGAVPTVYYFFDWRTKAFWPEAYADTDFEVSALLSYEPTRNNGPVVILGGRDGYVRVYEDSATDDDGTDFESNVLIGPIFPGRNMSTEGYIHGFSPTLDADSGDVDWSLLTGYDPQTARNATARGLGSGTFVAGRNRWHLPDQRAVAAYLKLEGTPGVPWAVDNIVMKTLPVAEFNKP